MGSTMCGENFPLPSQMSNIYKYNKKAGGLMAQLKECYYTTIL